MNIHKNARTTVQGRAEIVRRVAGGESPAAVAEALHISERTVCKWLSRFRHEGLTGLADRSSRPRRLPRLTPPALGARVEALRRQRWTCRQIAARVALSLATVARILRRRGLARLGALEAPAVVRRYERAHPGELVHMDTKKLGRFRRIGHRMTGDRRTCTPGIGWEYVHVCVDDASRVAYVEVLPDERQATARGFFRRAVSWWARAGVRVQRVMTDNGNAERFIQTLLREWAYVRPYDTSRLRRLALPGWLHHYNVHRPHMSLGGQPPISRLPSEE